MWLVISDTHIGDRQANKNLPNLFKLLNKYANKECTLVLNGDIIDFSKALEFDERHRIFFSIIQKFNNIIYIEGNHDWFVSGIKDVFPCISFRKELLIEIDSRIIRISHGHQTDSFNTKFPKFVRFLVRINRWIYEIIGIDIQHIVRKSWIVQKFLLLKQERKLIRMEKVANTIIAGHTHRPCRRIEYDTEYFNTGDWIDKSHMCYVKINKNGNIELVRNIKEDDG
jgi:UDP-2,3-diacylglucosamine pyrophosphatase LpxH